jgi:hypothetical protein
VEFVGGWVRTALREGGKVRVVEKARIRVSKYYEAALSYYFCGRQESPNLDLYMLRDEKQFGDGHCATRSLMGGNCTD